MGEVRPIVVSTRPASWYFGAGIDNCSFDFGSFPNSIWDGNGGTQTSCACADLSGGQFWAVRFDQGDLSYANCSNSFFAQPGSTYRAFAFFHCSLVGADFSGSVFYGAHGGPQFDQCDCTGTDFSGCQFINCNFAGGNFIGANFTGATFTNCHWNTDDYGGGSLGFGTRFQPTVYQTVIFDETTIWPAGFNTSVFPATRSAPYDFSNQTLNGTNLNQYMLGHASFENAVLNNVHLGNNCAWANFKNAQLLGFTFGTFLQMGTNPSEPFPPGIDANSFDPYSYPLVCWADFSNGTIDFGPCLGFRNIQPGLTVASTTHANFSNVQFIWSGAATYPHMRACTFFDANHAYTNFNGIKRPPGCILTWEESNCAWATFVGADIGPTDHVAEGTVLTNSGPQVMNYDWPDSNMSYCDFSGCQGGWFAACDLSNAKFVNANLMYSVFSEALLSYADMTGARARIECFERNTPLDAGTDPNQGGRGSIQALINHATKLPAGVSADDMTYALTNQQYPPDSAFIYDGHADFSFQTIDPTAYNYANGNFNGSPRLDGFGADFNHAHFQGVNYRNVNAYNSNLQGCTFDRAFNFGYTGGGADFSGSYQCHFGGPPQLVGVPRGASPGVPGPRAAWRVP